MSDAATPHHPRNSADIIQSAEQRLHSPIAIVALRKMVEGLDDTKILPRPLGALVGAINGIAKAIFLPDFFAEFDIDLLIKTASELDIVKDQAQADKLTDDYLRLRTEGRVICKGNDKRADFPMANQFFKDSKQGDKDPTGTEKEGWKDKKEMIETYRRFGGCALEIPKDDRNSLMKSSDGTMVAVRALGIELIWSSLDTAFMVRKLDHGEWRKWKKIEPPTFPEFGMMLKGITRAVGIVDHFYIDELNESGERILIGTRTLPNGEKINDYKEERRYKITPIASMEKNTGAFKANLIAQLGSEIERVDFTQDFTDEICKEIATLTDAERKECLEWAGDWLLRIPNIEIINADKHAELIKFICRMVYYTFARRRLTFRYLEVPARFRESPDEFGQRYIPTFIGAPKSGKSTICKNAFPNDGIFIGRKNTDFVFDIDGNENKRQASGMLQTINDELRGVTLRNADQTNAFATWASGPYHRKHHNYETMYRSDVMVANGMKVSKVPNEEGNRSRFTPIVLKKKDGIDPTDLHNGIVDFFETNRRKMIIGGFLLVEQGFDPNPCEKAEASIEAIYSERGLSTDALYEDTIIDLVEHGICSLQLNTGKYFVSTRLVALYARALKYQEKERLGETIEPTGKMGEEWEKDVELAWNAIRNDNDGKRKIELIEQAMHRLHGEECEKRQERIDFGDGSKKRKRFQGITIQDGDLADRWSVHNPPR